MTKITNSGIKNLSSIDKKLLLKSYDIYKSKSFSNEEAMDKAMFAVGKTSDDIMSHALGQNVNMQTALVKEGGFLNKKYFFDATLSSTTRDSHGHVASKSLLKWLDDNGKIENGGDIRHYALNGVDTTWKGLFKLVNHNLEGDKLKLRYSVDDKHKHFKEFLGMNKVTPFNMLSAEFINPRMIGNKIVYASKLGWTLTDKGSNPDAKNEMR